MCESTGCRVVYLSETGILHKEDVKIMVTFKEIDAPRPLCYCKQVTEEGILSAIQNGARTIDDVRRATGIGGGVSAGSLTPRVDAAVGITDPSSRNRFGRRSASSRHPNPP